MRFKHIDCTCMNFTIVAQDISLQLCPLCLNKLPNTPLCVYRLNHSIKQKECFLPLTGHRVEITLFPIIHTLKHTTGES